jgi:hypothetical protein
VLSAAVPSVLAGLSVFGYIPDMGLQQTAFATERLNDNLPEWHQELRLTFTVAISLANLIISLFCGFFGSICNILSYEMRLLSREIQVEVRGQAVIWDMKIVRKDSSTNNAWLNLQSFKLFRNHSRDKK